MVGQSGAKDSFTVPSGLKVLRVQADTAEYPLGYMLCCVSWKDETYCVLMALHYLYGYVGWIYVCDVSFIAMTLLHTRISLQYISTNQNRNIATQWTFYCL